MTKTLTKFLAGVQAAIDARQAFEIAKNPENENIQKTLAGIRSDFNHEAIAEVLVAANAPVDFINAAERNGARFNVYAAQKVANACRWVAGAGTLNHYTKAIIESAVRFSAAGVPFTHADAIAACSLSVKASPEKEALLTRYEKHVAPNTASTQASSSIAALKLLGALHEGKSPSGAVCYGLVPEGVERLPL